MSDIQNTGAQDVIDPDAEATTGYTGTVTRIPRDQIDICMDGAKYLLTTSTPEGDETAVRLRPIDDEADRVLDRAVDSGRQIAVTGYIRHVECTRLDVFQAESAREHGKQPVS